MASLKRRIEGEIPPALMALGGGPLTTAQVCGEILRRWGVAKESFGRDPRGKLLWVREYPKAFASLRKVGVIHAPAWGKVALGPAPSSPAEEAPVSAPPVSAPPVVEAPVSAPPAVQAAPEAEEAFGLLHLKGDEVAQHEVYDLRCPDTLSALIAAQPCFAQGPVTGCEECVLASHCGAAAEKRVAAERAAAEQGAAAAAREEEARVAAMAALEVDASAAGIDLSAVALPAKEMAGSEVLTLALKIACASSGVILEAGDKGALVMGWGVVHPLILRAEAEGRWPTRILEAS